jgi:2-amino-4-hydroxy-6-hydroxymethyldihydropteridine diphosphokinase
MIDGPPGGSTAYIGLGSNLDDPERRIARAIQSLDALAGTRVAARSSLYRSAPLGPPGQPDYLNAAVMLRTSLGARDLLGRLKAIEREQGREPGPRWGPRVIDLDLLVFDDAVIDVPGLTVPHPGIALRNFVLLPLREIAPDLQIPGLGRVADIAVDEHEPRIARVS